MKMINLTDEDATQVRAILLSFAEISDQQAIKSEELLARIKKDEPEEVDMIDCLLSQSSDFTSDSDNLKRIAQQFM